MDECGDRAPRGLRGIAGAVLVAASLLVGVPTNADTETLKIGVLATLEGAFEPLGRDALRGHELAMQEYEESDGERAIEAIVESTDGTPDSVVAKARLLIEQGASIVIGPLAGIEGIAIRDFAKSVPEVTFINGASAAQDATLRTPAENFFRFNPDSMQWIGGLGRYAYDEKDIETIVTVSEDYSLPYTQLMGFVLDYCEAGGRLLARHWVSPGASDTGRLAETVARTETDGVFLALEPRAAGKFLAAYGEAGGEAAIVASSTTLSGGLLRSADTIRPLLTGAISALPVSESDDNDEWAELTTRYRETFPDAGPAPGLLRACLLRQYQGAAPRPRRGRTASLGDGHEDLRRALGELEFDTPFGGPVALDENRQAVTTNFIVEVEEEDDSLALNTVEAEEDVNQTLGHPRDAFLALGPPSRLNTLCPETALAEVEVEPAAARARGRRRNACRRARRQSRKRRWRTVEAPADTLRDKLIERLQKDAAMPETGPTIVPCLSYRDAPAAIAWLEEAFGFTENFVVPGPGRHHRPCPAHLRHRHGDGGFAKGRRASDADSVRLRRHHAVDLHRGRGYRRPLRARGRGPALRSSASWRTRPTAPATTRRAIRKATSGTSAPTGRP